FFDSSQPRLALQNTFILGLSAATAGTLLVTVIAYLSVRRLVWGHRYLSFLAMAPVAIPGIVLAVGLFLSYTHPPLLLYGTLAIIFLAYVTKEIPVGYQQIGASLKAVHPELEDAGRIFGATRLRTLADITAPLIRNGVVATWILIFIGSIRELSATISAGEPTRHRKRSTGHTVTSRCSISPISIPRVLRAARYRPSRGGSPAKRSRSWSIWRSPAASTASPSRRSTKARCTPAAGASTTST